MMKPVSWGLLFILAACLSACVSSTIGSLTSPSAPAPAPALGVEAGVAPHTIDRLVGAWGVASYREEKDRARTEAQAQTQCRQPYVIRKGPTDGVMMHVADDATPHELALKKGADGNIYLGFAGPPGDPQDRIILSMSDKVFVTRYVDPDTNARYGTFVYVRCAKA